MFNVDFIGTIGKVTFKNDKVMKFKLNGIDKNSKKYVTICCFDATKFEALEKAEGIGCEEDSLYVHLPTLHLHLYPHRLRCTLQEGRVEAGRTPWRGK